jgi:hypothetical protein
MTVKEYLDTNNALYIKLGAKSGQSFIYCGLSADARDFLETYDEPYKEKLHNNLLRAIHEHAQLINGSFNKVAERLIEQYKEYRRDRRKGGDAYKKNKKLEAFKSLAAYKRHLKRLEQKEIVKAEIRIERYTKRFQNYTPILDRLIVDTYESILRNEDGYIDTIVIYEGDEAGIAWDLTEFRRGGQYEE